MCLIGDVVKSTVKGVAFGVGVVVGIAAILMLRSRG